MPITTMRLARVAAAMSAVAFAAACGGGGGGAPSAPPPVSTPVPPRAEPVVTLYNKPTGTGTSTSATYGNLGYFAYSERNDVGRPSTHADAGLINVTGSIPAGNRYGGIQVVVYAPSSTFNPETNVGRIAVQSFHSQSELRLIAGSTTATRLQVQLIPQGGPFNGCVPTAEMTVDAAPQVRTLPLNPRVWAVPSHCTAAERSLSLSDTLAHLSYVTVAQLVTEVPNVVEGVASSFTLGEISFAGESAATIDFNEVVTTFNHTVGGGTSLAALNGALGFDLFSEQGNATAGPVDTGRRMASVSVSVPLGNRYGGLMLQSFGPGSTWVPQVADPARGTGTIVYHDYSQEKRLRIQVGSRSVSQVLVRLTQRNGPFGSCVPSFLLPVTSMTVSRDISLTDPRWFVPTTDCTTQDQARTPQQALSELHMVSVGVTERSVPEILTDGLPRDFTLGEIDFVR